MKIRTFAILAAAVVALVIGCWIFQSRNESRMETSKRAALDAVCLASQKVDMDRSTADRFKAPTDTVDYGHSLSRLDDSRARAVAAGATENEIRSSELIGQSMALKVVESSKPKH